MLSESFVKATVVVFSWKWLTHYCSGPTCRFRIYALLFNAQHVFCSYIGIKSNALISKVASGSPG